MPLVGGRGYNFSSGMCGVENFDGQLLTEPHLYAFLSINRDVALLRKSSCVCEAEGHFSLQKIVKKVVAVYAVSADFPERSC